ncbi:MAG TPA: (S)-ureidoglycine aminohydrolase [Pirellulales bacterium]|nr:(S)-ureidoglycine aminohydrolase [Pirellulales bacterium]
MRAAHELLHSRTRVRPRYALLPLEGYPPSRLPAWPGVEARILASPALGAEFVQYLLNVPQGLGTDQQGDGRVETFLYLLEGSATLSIDRKRAHHFAAGAFALVPPAYDYRFEASEPCTLLTLRKAYEPAAGIDPPKPIIGDQSAVPAVVYMGNEGARLQTLLPDDLSLDLAMNIFTFSPGHSLPVVETHVMEHGLYFLQGKGVYYLDDAWMEVTAGDYVWMGPYVPQSFYATGPVPSKYIYYKNVNRDISL